MVSKETLILVAVLIILVMGFMLWSTSQSDNIQSAVDDQIQEVLEG